MKAPVTHIGLLLDSFNLFGAGLITNDETGKEYLKEIYDSLPFLSNKILKLEKENDTKWAEALMAICKAHHSFIQKNFDAVHAWTGTQAGLEQALAAGIAAVVSAPQ
jgi:hypothetical protein